MSNSQQVQSRGTPGTGGPGGGEAGHAAGTAGSTISRAQEMLLEFLRENDATCPVCGYNVRALTRPICPECRQDLVLTVGAPRLQLGWLLAALAPGFFSGIAAVFLLFPMTMMYLNIGTVAPMIAAVDLFGWSSGVFAIFLARKRIRFFAQPRARQRHIALAIWLLHVAALATFIFIGVMFG